MMKADGDSELICKLGTGCAADVARRSHMWMGEVMGISDRLQEEVGIKLINGKNTFSKIYGCRRD